MDKNNSQDNPNRIMDLVFGFQRSRVILTAYELGVFTALSGESKTSREIAKIIGADERAADRLMNALCAIGLFDKSGEKFSNSSVTAKFLVKDSPDFMSGLLHSVHTWDSWSTLTQSVRQGTSVLKKDINERGKKWLTAFIEAMHWRAMKHAQQVVSLIDCSGVMNVLDVGGGSGAYAMAFAQVKEGIQSTVFDLSKVIPLTQTYIKKAGLTDKVRTVIGDYNKDDLGDGFDLIFFSAVIHINSPEQNRKLIEKAAKALKPNGQVVVQDFIVDENRTSPPFAALFALNMLVATECGDTYPETEVRNWLLAAGLSEVIRKDTEFGTSLIIGRK
ncbi:MAG: methyltransferase [Planctomycetes bacterium]|nr:methyltransferase [Planctomycetota bacterium]